MSAPGPPKLPPPKAPAASEGDRGDALGDGPVYRLASEGKLHYRGRGRGPARPLGAGGIQDRCRQVVGLVVPALVEAAVLQPARQAAAARTADQTTAFLLSEMFMFSLSLFV